MSLQKSAQPLILNLSSTQLRAIPSDVFVASRNAWKGLREYTEDPPYTLFLEMESRKMFLELALALPALGFFTVKHDSFSKLTTPTEDPMLLLEQRLYNNLDQYSKVPLETLRLPNASTVNEVLPALEFLQRSKGKSFQWDQIPNVAARLEGLTMGLKAIVDSDASVSVRPLPSEVKIYLVDQFTKAVEGRLPLGGSATYTSRYIASIMLGWSPTLRLKSAKNTIGNREKARKLEKDMLSWTPHQLGLFYKTAIGLSLSELSEHLVDDNLHSLAATIAAL